MGRRKDDPVPEASGAEHQKKYLVDAFGRWGYLEGLLQAGQQGLDGFCQDLRILSAL